MTFLYSPLRAHFRAGGLALAALMALSSLACSDSWGAGRVAALRAHYRANLVGFMVLPGAAAQAPSAAAAGAPVASDLELRIQIQHDSPEKLAGLTLEVQRLGPDGDDVERQHERLWVDVSAIEAGPGGEVRATLRGVPYVPGERLHVFVRQSVPASERAAYREFGH